jgi:phenylalanyl-tRNA synthetase beta chain
LPAIVRDLTMLVSDRIAAADVVQAISVAGGELCESVVVASEFRGGSVPQGERSLTFRVVYRDPAARLNAEQARTLTDKEVDDVEARVLESTREKLGITLRA